MEARISEGHKDNFLTEQNRFGALMVFNQNHHFAYIYKKTEKLVTAVYMITNFIKDTEPLKGKIREKALALLDLNMSFNTVSLADRRDLLKQYEAYALEIVSLSSIAHFAGLISEMNFRILSREFNGLVATMEKDENKKANEETVMLNPDFFNAPQPTVVRQSESSPIPTPERSIVESDKNEVRHVHTHTQTHTNESHKGQSFIKDNDRIQAVKTETKYSKVDRQSVIIKLLSKKSGLSIKDFIGSIKGVSEKTIQRELLTMVATGILKKEGERRWSTYSLA